MASTLSPKQTRAALWLSLGLAVGCAEGRDPPAATAVVSIPGGTFTMGVDEGDVCRLFETNDRRAELRTEPRVETARATHQVTVQAFCIDEHEVTNEQYRHCNARGDCPLPQSTNAGNRGQEGFVATYFAEDAGFDDYPVLGVAHQDAAKYCAFRGGYLPTEAQWEYVATSLGTRDRVWEDRGLDGLIEGGCESDLDRQGSVAYGACTNGVAPVKGSSADETAQGVFDMAGNAAEWVADDFDYFAYCADEQPGGSIETIFSVEGRSPRSRADEAVIAPFEPMGDEQAPLEISVNNGGGAGNSDWEGTCVRDVGECTDRCGDAFGNDADIEGQQSRWTGYLCGDLRGEDPDKLPLTDSAVEALLDGFPTADGCDEQCVVEWNNCRATAPTPPDGGPQCIRACTREADECLVRATISGVSTACIQFTNNGNCVPVPWCVPRADYAAEVPHIRPSALTSEPLEGTKTVRGGHFQGRRLCEAFPAWRNFELVSSPLIGFRCAYDAGTPRCPAR